MLLGGVLVTLGVLVKGGQVRGGVAAPKSVAVHRREVYERIRRHQRAEPVRRTAEVEGPAIDRL